MLVVNRRCIWVVQSPARIASHFSVNLFYAFVGRKIAGCENVLLYLLYRVAKINF